MNYDKLQRIAADRVRMFVADCRINPKRSFRDFARSSRLELGVSPKMLIRILEEDYGLIIEDDQVVKPE